MNLRQVLFFAVLTGAAIAGCSGDDESSTPASKTCADYCGAGATCVDGTCVPLACDPACGAGMACENGECTCSAPRCSSQSSSGGGSPVVASVVASVVDALVDAVIELVEPVDEPAVPSVVGPALVLDVVSSPVSVDSLEPLVCAPVEESVIPVVWSD